jgi:peroxiredoxin
MTETTTSEAPPLDVERWFNTDAPPTLAGLRGKVVVLHAFQMLCPGCVAHAVPQARRLHEIARRRGDLVVLGLHSVFEHHAAMTPVSLEAFLHEYRIEFPVAVDRASVDGPIPRTMAAYGLRGTPSTIVIDRAGAIVRHSFGPDDDLVLGLLIGGLLAESA